MSCISDLAGSRIGIELNELVDGAGAKDRELCRELLGLLYSRFTKNESGIRKCMHACTLSRIFFHNPRKRQPCSDRG